MIGVSFGIFLIIAGLCWRFKRHRPASKEFSSYWLENILPEHEHEQSKRR